MADEIMTPIILVLLRLKYIALFNRKILFWALIKETAHKGLSWLCEMLLSAASTKGVRRRCPLGSCHTVSCDGYKFKFKKQTDLTANSVNH